MLNRLDFTKLNVFLILLFICSLSFGCSGLTGGDDSATQTHIEPSTASGVTHIIDPVVPATSYTLDQRLTTFPANVAHSTDAITLSPLPAGSPALRSVNFAFTTEELNIQPGHILAGPISTAKPKGYLKKVKSVRKENGNIFIDTENVPLEEAVQEAHMNISHPVKKKNVTSFSPAMAGVKLNDKEFMHDNISLGIDILIHDEDGNEKTTNDQIRATGNIAIQMSLDGVIKIHWFKLEHFKLYGKVKEQLDLKITASKGLRVKKVIPLGHIDIEPITFLVGIIPVIIEPKIELNLTFDGSISMQASIGFTQTFSLAAGMQVVDGKLKPYSEGPVFNVTPPTQTLGLNAALDIAVGPEVEASFYDIGGPAIGVDLYFSADANAQVSNGKPSADLDLKFGLRGLVTGKIDALTKLIGEIKLTIFDIAFWEKKYSTDGSTTALFPAGMNDYAK